MRHQYDTFLRDSLSEMNFSISELEDNTPLGEDGLDVDSLASSELAMRVSDVYDVSLPAEDVMSFPELRYGQLVDLLLERLGNDS